jgi:hypothetical protein
VIPWSPDSTAKRNGLLLKEASLGSVFTASSPQELNVNATALCFGLDLTDRPAHALEVLSQSHMVLWLSGPGVQGSRFRMFHFPNPNYREKESAS